MEITYEVYKNIRDFNKGKCDRAVDPSEKPLRSTELSRPSRTSKLTTNDIVDLYWARRGKNKLTIRKVGKGTVLIEGSAVALEFLGRYLIAHSQTDEYDCGVELSPSGPGRGWFTKASTLGFYVHRLPCREDRKQHRRG